jgi:hypothetical protein
MRVRKVVESLPTQSDFELFTEEEERVSFEDEMTEKFEVFTDDAFPGQFRVVGDKIEKVPIHVNGFTFQAPNSPTPYPSRQPFLFYPVPISPPSHHTPPHTHPYHTLTPTPLSPRWLRR